MRTIAAISVATAIAITLPTSAHADATQTGSTPITTPGYEFSLIGEHNLPGTTRYAGTTVGGITGVDYDQASGGFRLLSDDRGDTRFYTGRFTLHGNCPKPVLTGVSRLREADGGRIAGADPQALRYDAATRRVLWADAGERTTRLKTDPAVREATAKGTHVGRFATPDVQKVAVDGQGAQRGLSLSGLALTPDGGQVLTALRGPLAQDGDAIRLTLHDRASGDPLVQFAYRAENGISEILSLDESRFLVLEQAGANSAKLYEIDFALGATNVADLPALAGQSFLPVTKRLVLDLTRLGLKRVDDLEAATWGPTLADGTRTLVFVSDNGLDRRQHTQLIAVKVRLL
ncbi:esterase-like activity of phytase family protein [Saccharothrix obliqua]|uniref:esterase-like activity of phytase family protein n=1 Tax=Saccharothrix obliqua TaxID=2861747 RepID=UPI001C5CFE54|nr:esterase-like activity of phytase family protein [Saccharothrix obliqua]MBW4716896.1 esterase-like activity of phytase family protein [Saccharothrix obliqua]